MGACPRFRHFLNMIRKYLPGVGRPASMGMYAVYLLAGGSPLIILNVSVNYSVYCINSGL